MAVGLLTGLWLIASAQSVDTLTYLKQQQRQASQFNGVSINLLAPMTFPQLKQTPATWDGAFCKANGKKNKKAVKKSLCPGLRGYKAEFEISGEPRSYVDIHVFGNETKQGLTFTVQNKSGGFSKRVRIKKSGVGTFSAGGIITLSNAHETGSGEYAFSYTVTALYQ
ncbi:hypothetical protein [Pseudoalteromonas ardens]|uniref:hypothetical protein n=1 Tax=Pseudoalteromonas ardens TaxID=3048490 RepID=UPI0024C2C181|nr:hypothetical protein [Pseudoalteromonas sp. R96]MDK1313455.1 hypothetical protein [Pseudoalteromonas sp. R96]